MDITPFLETLRQDLQAAAAAGGPDLEQAAQRLSYALEPAARLALMEAVSQAASEITSELPSGSVEVRLEGRQLAFVVQAPAAVPAAAPAVEPDEAEDDGNLARITLRLPESLKTKAEEKAQRAGDSLNTWLVRVIRQAANDRGITVDVDLSSIPFFGDQGRHGNKRMTGWI